MSDASLVDRWRSRTAQKWVPLQASLELTFRCNERCQHCYIETFKDDPDRKLNFEGWQKILQELRSAGTLYIILMGGEAMLHPDFWIIAQEASRLNFHVSMITNGLRIKESSTAKKLKDSGVQAVTFSLYSLRSEVHDRMTRVRGSLKNTLKAIDHCQEAGLQIALNSLLTKDNIGHIFALEDWCLNKGLELKVDPTITPTLEGGLAPTELRASEDQLRWFYKERTRRWANSRPMPSGEKATDFVCNAAKGKCAVNPYGDLLPCIEVREPIGNLLTHSFNDIWHSSTAEKWRQIKVDQLKDRPKGIQGEFCEHCPGMAKNEGGDPLEVSSYSRKLAEIKNAAHLNSL